MNNGVPYMWHMYNIILSGLKIEYQAQKTVFNKNAENENVRYRWQAGVIQISLASWCATGIAGKLV
jgi:hypothetical protein